MDGPNGLRPRGVLVLENADSVSGQKSLRFFWNLSYLRKRWQTTKLMIHCMKSAKQNGNVVRNVLCGHIRKYTKDKINKGIL